MKNSAKKISRKVYKGRFFIYSMLKGKRGQSELGWILAVVLVVVILVAVLWPLTNGFKDFNKLRGATKLDANQVCAVACSNPDTGVFCGKDEAKTTFGVVDAKGAKISGTCYELSNLKKADGTPAVSGTPDNERFITPCSAISTCA